MHMHIFNNLMFSNVATTIKNIYMQLWNIHAYHIYTYVTTKVYKQKLTCLFP